MKTLVQYINEERVWGVYYWDYEKYNQSEVDTIFAKLQKIIDKDPKDSPYRDDKIAKVLKKYPVAIVIDKLGYQAENDGKKVNVDKYTKFLYNKIKSNEVTGEELAKWLGEYNREVQKNNWLDITYLLKNIDYNKIWNVYNPKDDSTLNSIIEHPVEIIYCLNDTLRKRRSGLSKEELEMVKSYYSDPANQEMLQKSLNKAKSKMLKFRPSFSDAAANCVKKVLNNTTVNGKYYDFEENFAIDDKPKTRYHGESNYSDEHCKAYYSLVIKTINGLYGFTINRNSNWKDEDNFEYKHYVKKNDKDNDDLLEKFVNDTNDLKIEIKDLGESKEPESTSGVWSSSFSTSIKHDFNVIVKLKDEEIFNQDFKDIVVSSSFYSGGWN